MEMTKEYRKMMRKRGFWMGLALFLLGIIIGILCSQAKNGISIGSNNRVNQKDDEDSFLCEAEESDSDEI